MKSVAEEWEKIRDDLVARQNGAVMIGGMKCAFYAGVQCFVESTIEMIEAETEHEESLQLLDEINREIVEYFSQGEGE